MGKDLVSVIIAVNNGEKYITEAVNSILNQTYHNLEVIIIENCSNDNTLKTIEKIKDNRIKIYNTNICQLAFNLNYGLMVSKGEYVARIDADDVAMPDRIEKQLKCLIEYNYDIVGSNLELIDDIGKTIGYKIYPENNNDIRRKMYFSNSIAHPSVMYRKSTILKVGGYVNGLVTQDHDLWIRLMRDKNVIFYNIQENLTKYRIHGSQSKGNIYAYCESAAFLYREFLFLKSIKCLSGALMYTMKYAFCKCRDKFLYFH